jgi:hypothetical protein
MEGHPGVDDGSCAGRRADLEVAVEEAGALAHAEQAEVGCRLSPRQPVAPVGG